MREMAGLSILLEGYQKETASVTNQNPQVINKTLSIKPPSPPPPPSSSLYFSPTSPLPAITFLDSCFLCKQRLLPGNDIYMYKGDRAFCSVECRCRQIFMDEECVVSVGNGRERNCSFSARKPINGKSTSTSTSSSRRRTQGNKNRSDWFIY